VVVIVMARGASNKQVAEVGSMLERHGFRLHRSGASGPIVIRSAGSVALADLNLNGCPGVERVVDVSVPYKLASRAVQADDTVVQVGDAVLGGGRTTVIAGPCAVESRPQMMAAAESVARSGARILRGGAFKPRTSPYSFQGMEEEGVALLAEAGRTYGLATVTEVINASSLEIAAQYVDMLQIGSRNMQNFDLLRAVGQTTKPVLLKRGMSSTIEEWLMAAEYIMSEGNGNVVLCERGIRTFEQMTRNTLDLSAVPLVKSLSHLPVIVDPSHATGDPRLIAPMSRAAVAAGADGIIVEVHPCPSEALCDGKQSLTPEAFADLMSGLEVISRAMGRE
jgi:3-deoxy-7-phosphoheptulonate synthase